MADFSLETRNPDESFETPRRSPPQLGATGCTQPVFPMLPKARVPKTEPVAPSCGGDRRGVSNDSSGFRVSRLKSAINHAWITTIPYAATSDTSLNLRKLRVFRGSACLDGGLGRPESVSLVLVVGQWGSPCGRGVGKARLAGPRGTWVGRSQRGGTRPAEAL